MKRKKTRRIMWTVISGIVITISFILFYWPFVQVQNIDVEENIGGYLDDSWHDTKMRLRLRLKLYPLCWFIHKGDVYSDIPLLDKDSIPRKMTIKFNWDNSVIISDSIHEYCLHVKKVEIAPELCPFADDTFPFRYHETDDSLFVGIFMFDDKNSELDIYRQNRKKPYKGKRVGFRVNINGNVYVTEGKERFNY